MIKIYYTEICPVCKNTLTLEEINKNICLKKNKKLYSETKKELKDFEFFFKKLSGKNLRKIQKLWAKRLLEGKSQTLLAPTGIGKTVFGIIFSLYLAIYKNKKCYILFPTTTLIKNIKEKIENFSYKIDKPSEILFYYGGLKQKIKKEIKEKIKNSEFEILITTYAFLSKDFEILKQNKFDFVFIDDIDSLLKNSRNLDKILQVLKPEGSILISSATGKPGKGAKILKEKTGLEIGAFKETLRKIEDFIYEEKDIDKLINILKELGKGGLLFASSEEQAEFLYQKIKNVIPSKLIISGKDKELKDFIEGKIHVLIGISKPYGLLVRGIDLPKQIRYAVFWGAPSFKFDLKREKIPQGIIEVLSKKVSSITGNKKIKALIKKRNYHLLEKEIKEFINREREEMLLRIGVVKEKEMLWIPDIKAYIQASGRTSRLFSGGLSQGLSIIFEESKYLEIFKERASIWDIDFKELNINEIKKILKIIDNDRREMENPTEEFDPVTPLLFVVESPNKAKQIAKFFGKPVMRKIGDTTGYEVFTGEYLLLIVASIGHMVDLTTENIGTYGIEKENGDFILYYSPIKRCRDCNYQFADSKNKCPKCGSENIYNALNRINSLRTMASEIENVLIGTDPDTEGEKIAWDIYNLLKPYSKEIKRAEFHEVTKNAILKAIKEKREISISLVNAQLVRRIEDRLIGFKLSHKVQSFFKDYFLSAGRAQSPVLGWIVQREKELARKKPFFINNDLKIRWKLNTNKKFKTGKQKLKFKIQLIKEKEKKRIIHPFRTDTMLKEAQRILKMSTSQTMKSAQKLFEMGLITYHRTDSIRVSEKGLTLARYILKEKFKKRTFEGRGAHECIRPTKPISPEELKENIENIEFTEPLTQKEISLYKLIYSRFLSSQTEETTEKVKIYKIKIEEYEFEEERLVWAKGLSKEFYPYMFYIVPELPEGEIYIEGKIFYYPEVFPYTQAEIVSIMKEKEIGRPSTYSTLIERLFQRGYIYEKNGFVRASELGKKVFYFLNKNYFEFINEERTKIIEKRMDEVEEGRTQPEKIIESIFNEIQRIK